MNKLSQLWIRLLMLALCQTQASAQVTPRLEVMYSGWKQEPFQPDLHNDVVRHPEDGALYGTSKKGGALGYGMIFRLTGDGEMQALVQFTGAVGPFKGAEPSGALVVGADGSLYGMTTKGGRSDFGTLFKVTRQGEFTTLIDLGEFTIEVRGDNPSGGLILASDGNFYGTTRRGGFPGTASTLFRLTPGGVFTTLRDFDARQMILGRLVVGPDGHFYGMAREGGLGSGSIFRVTTAGVMTSLVEFTGSDGTFPTGGLTVGGDGLLYGMTPEGGNSGGGTLFSLTTDGVMTKLIHFTQEQPLGNLTLGVDGLLYGMTQYGGTSGAGKVFRLSAEGVLTTLVNFSDNGSSNKGALPMGSLTLAADGHFYGMTSVGGAFGHGTVFRLTSAGDLTTLYEMRRDGAGDTGGMPLSGLVRASDDKFYGMTRRGGAAGHGTLFQMSTTGVRTTLVDFPRLGDVSVGPQPQGRLIQGADGDLYGMTRAGGSYGYGSVFRVTTAGVMTTLTSFRGQFPGFMQPENPFGGLVEGAAGNFYGATNYGGMSGLGALFKITSSGSYTHLLDFTGDGAANKGARMAGELTLGADGQFYGVTQGGGSFSKGTAFRMTSAGVLTTVVHFTGNEASNKGLAPVGKLVQATDGHFYGMTRWGGSQDLGTIFKMTSAGVVTTLVEFTGNGTTNKGAEPEGSLFQAADGNFYGMTHKGGARGRGTVFRMTPAGLLTTLVEFTGIGSGVNGGAFPMYSQFVDDADGNLWGTTSVGGAGGGGLVFKVSPFYKAISIRGYGVEITPGSATSSTLNDTDFGPMQVPEIFSTRTFTIVNSGSTSLALTGTPKVMISGTAASDFQVMTGPSSTVASLSSTTFQIAFDPTEVGVRQALVTVTNDDPERSSYSFAISGVGLPARSAQTITFAELPQVYQAEGPITLGATASSGLPVTYAVISGPAAVSANRLTLNGSGLVQIRATQVGDEGFYVASPVIRVLKVLANPTSPVLLDLKQTYTGMPRIVRAIADAPTTVQYKVGSLWVNDAPTAAGSYPVIGRVTSIGKQTTDKLVIAKAPLSVLPHPQRKFAGQPNPVLGFDYSGFLGSDTAANSVSKAPVITTTATSNSVGGLYPIKASGGTSANYAFVYQTSTMKVETFAGGYEALLLDTLPAAKLELTVAASSRTFTGKLTTFHETAAVSLRGDLITQIIAETATSTATTKVGTNTYVVTFTLPLSGEFTATATRNGLPIGTATDGKKLLVLAKGQLLGYVGAHTAILAPAQPAANAVPAGSGWATGSINMKGVLKLVGKLGDGTSFTTSLSADGQSDPGYRLFIQPYTPARTGSFAAGDFTLKPHPNIANRRQVPASDVIDLIWRKAQRDADKSYRAGFGPVTTRLTLDPWLPPAAATKTSAAIPLAARLKLTNPANEFDITHGNTGSASQPDLPTRLFINSSSVAVSIAEPVTTPLNKTKWKIIPAATTGAFTGSFELIDVGKKRLVTFSGVLRQPEDGSSGQMVGSGHYLLPALPGGVSTGTLLFELP